MKYSMPEYLVEKWKAAYGVKTTEKILEDFLTERPITVRCRTHKASLREIVTSLKSQGVTVEQAPYLPYALKISDYNHILTLETFLQGKILVQDVSSMLVAEAASPKKRRPYHRHVRCARWKKHPCGRQNGGLRKCGCQRCKSV